MPIAPTPPIPAYGSRSAVIQLQGPKDTPQIKQFNKELKKLARKYGATFKMRAKSRRAKARAKRKR
jgi:hypothetical protein